MERERVKEKVFGKRIEEDQNKILNGFFCEERNNKKKKSE